MKFTLLGFSFNIEVKVIKPRKTRTKGYHTKRWSIEDEATLLKMYSEGMHVKYIAQELGRTPQAVTAKVYNLKNSK